MSLSVELGFAVPAELYNQHHSPPKGSSKLPRAALTANLRHGLPAEIWTWLTNVI